MKIFKHTKLSRKCSRMLAMLLVMVMGFAYCTGITAFAAVDLDVTIIPPSESVQNGRKFDVNLEIVTKSDNGYTDLVIKIEYDADLLALFSPVNQDGYRVTGSKGQLTLSYIDPTGTKTPTPIGNSVTIPITFTVLNNAPDTKTKIRATIDHAYNARGKNVTWTPIYDKEIEIIRINESVSSDTDSSEDESSQFVVGKNTGTVSRASSGVANGGKAASVVIGAIVVFAAGMAAGYILCMKRYETLGASPVPERAPSRPKRGRAPDDEDEYSHFIGEYKSRSAPEDEFEGLDNEDGFYTRAEEKKLTADKENYYRPSTSGGRRDDYLRSSTVGNDDSGGFLDEITAGPTGGKSLSADDYGKIVRGKAKLPVQDDDYDDYPILFMTRDGSGQFKHTGTAPSSAAPVFDEEEDTIFGKFTDNVDRNTDDGYGGLSPASRRRDRTERARRNR